MWGQGSVVRVDIDSVVERICAKGCRAVRADIQTLLAGHDLPETRSLDAVTRHRVLAELVAVMEVYGDECAVEAPRSEAVEAGSSTSHYTSGS